MAKSKGKSKKTNNSKKIEEVVTTDGDLMDKFFIVAGVILFLLCFYSLCSAPYPAPTIIKSALSFYVSHKNKAIFFNFFTKKTGVMSDLTL